jgi:hypothetical protein
MPRTIRWAGPLAALALALSPASAQQKDPAQKPAGKDRLEAKDRTVPAGEITGKLVRIESAQKTLAVQISIPYFIGRNLNYRHVDIELQTADDVKVRLANPPLEFDAKGNPKRYTAKELKALRGPGNLPGFPGDFDSLKNEQIVKCFLKRPKDPPRLTGKDPKRDQELLNQSKPVVDMVFILVEPRR